MLDRRSCYVLVLWCNVLTLIFIGVGFTIAMLSLLECHQRTQWPLPSSSTNRCDPAYKPQVHLSLMISVFFVMVMLWCIQLAARPDLEQDEQLEMYAEKSVTYGITFAITCGWILIGLLNTGGWFSAVSLFVLMSPSVFVWSLECCTE